MSATLTDVALYLRRLGHDQPPAPTLATLRALQARHTAAFPFETLSTLLQLPVPLDLPSIERLEAALVGYPGAIVLVSHDEAFARACTRSCWRIDGRGIEVGSMGELEPERGSPGR